ncbi:uncharacterized protein HD556DRAFT_1456311 [Suillus plorans]|uniref:Uncharacterized protein n=1 Tax=Suillus plorans TaxID=116603 RepID=A0A9P7ACT6_9AGAM|nr:uncharacterized protein HD556DRAFT_1456311 [Suillus plorans]KAG1785780.1 hypothetical protein HD556DRAFT_1456311 [Suillus plorans]
MTKNTSTKTYNLRSRTRTRASSVSTPASEKNALVRDVYANFIVDLLSLADKAAKDPVPVDGTPAPAESPLTSIEGSPRTEAKSPTALETTRSYSEVVRASSPASDHRVGQESITDLDGINARANDNVSTPAGGTNDHVTFRTANEGSESSGESDDGDDRPWTTVGRRSRRGLKDLTEQAKKPGELTVEQIKTVDTARKSLTEAERVRLSQREANIKQHMSNRQKTRGPETAGPSKGKGADPGNWGALDSEEDIDLEGQRAALESYKAAKELAEASDSAHESEENGSLTGPDPPLASSDEQPDDIFTRAVREQQVVKEAVRRAERRVRQEYEQKMKELTSKLKGDRRAHTHEPARAWIDPVEKIVNRAMEPVGQVAAKSYIRQALGRLGKGYDDGDESDSSSSSSSSSSSDTSSSSSDDVRRKHKKSSKKRSKNKKTMLKPIAPTTYDGAVDSRAFHRFITEGTAYVKDGHVKSKKRAFVLSHFLKGKAHEFYIREEVQAAAEIIEIAHSVPMGREKRSGQKERAPAAITAGATTPVSNPRRNRDRRSQQDDRTRATKLGPGASGDTEHLRELAESTTTQDEVFLGSTALWLEDVDSSCPPSPKVRPRGFRDPTARRAADLLQGIKYPGDERGDLDQDWDDHDRFNVYSITFIRTGKWT